MVAKVTWGHGVLNAMVRPLPVGGMIAVGDSYWNQDSSEGYPGYDGSYWFGIGYNTYFQADSDRTVGAFITWLTGKTTGATLLVLRPIVSPARYPYGDQFAAGMARLGHIPTYTDTYSTFGGYDPFAFDAVLIPETLSSQAWPPGHEYTYTAAQQLDYLLMNGGRVLIGVTGQLDRYGIRAGGWHDGDHFTGTFGPPNWKLQRYFTSTELGTPAAGGSWGTQYWALPLYTSYYVYLDEGTKTMGGTTSLASCLHTGHAAGPPSHAGVVGFWRL